VTPFFLLNQTLIGSFLKRSTDIFLSCFALVLSSPVLVFVCIAIKISSRGPIFYKAKRVGKHGRLFHMVKFRTMYLNSDTKGSITSPNDKRIFKFGRLLRSLKLDEFPQFFNVLIGDMSIVGPRPEDPMIVRLHYSEWMIETLKVLPGVTSPGSIFGFINGTALLSDEDPERSYISNMMIPKLAIDRAYVDNASFFIDLACIFKTLYVVLASLLRI